MRAHTVELTPDEIDFLLSMLVFTLDQKAAETPDNRLEVPYALVKLVQKLADANFALQTEVQPADSHIH